MWVFNGQKNQFPSALFETYKEAALWIRGNKLTGTLTEYPVGISVYDWAIKVELFSPKKNDHYSAEFISNFSSAFQEHFHFENGLLPEELHHSENTQNLL